jgi:hypothetical protein
MVWECARAAHALFTCAVCGVSGVQLWCMHAMCLVADGEVLQVGGPHVAGWNSIEEWRMKPCVCGECTCVACGLYHSMSWHWLVRARKRACTLQWQEPLPLCTLHMCMVALDGPGRVDQCNCRALRQAATATIELLLGRL